MREPQVDNADGSDKPSQNSAELTQETKAALKANKTKPLPAETEIFVLPQASDVSGTDRISKKH